MATYKKSLEFKNVIIDLEEETITELKDDNTCECSIKKILKEIGDHSDLTISWTKTIP